ncbi:MAG: alpha amylase N-terminal ig-like domain-containing protein [Pyrinomonadaceae bacterium]
MNRISTFLLLALIFISFSAAIRAGRNPSVPLAAMDNNVEWNGLLHDSFDQFYRAPFGSVTAGTTVILKFRTFKNDVTAIFLRTYVYNPPTNTTTGPIEQQLSLSSSDATYDYWSIDYQTPGTPKIVYYKFRVVDGTDSDFYSDSYFDDNDNLNQGGPGAPSDNEPFPSFQLTVYDPNFTTPAWIHKARVYQIFPDRFRNGDTGNDWCRTGSTTGCPSLYGAPPASNIAYTNWNSQICDPRQNPSCLNNYGSQFFGGDLKGIESKLDYIKNLGFDTIYLNPIFKARSNHRYDTDDYLKIADELGGDAAFASLVAAANARGMRIILDGVWNHMSQDSEYFDFFHRSSVIGACESASSAYRSWFNFFNNNAPCTVNDYEGWFGFSGLPVFNDNLPAVRDFFYRTPGTNVTQYWYDRGAGGWRFDVATDLPHDWWNEYRGFAKNYKPDGVLIGEIFPDASQYLAGDQLDGVMNYRFRKNVLGFARRADFEDNDNNGNNRIFGLNPSQFDRAMRSIREDYPLPAQKAMLNLLDSHDTNRALYALTVASDSGLTQAKERLKLAAVFQFAYIGAPMVYYGDEAGINAPSRANGGNGLPEDDPYNRAPYPWADQSGDPTIYGPVDQNLIDFYAKLGKIRRDHPALSEGSFETLLTGDTSSSATDNDTYAFGRTDGTDKVIVALNNGATANNVTLQVASYFPNGTIVADLLGGARHTISGGNITFDLPPRSGAIIARNPLITPFDFDGDSKTDISIFRPAPGEWWYLRSSDTGNRAFAFGTSTDRIVPADFTGDGRADIAFWRESTGEWFILRSEDSSFYSFPFGAIGDVPAPADFDGDGQADPAIFRPSSATWFILNSSGGTTITGFGSAEDRPVPADYDGDGRADIAIFRPSDGSWWLNRSSSGLIVTNFGTGTDKTVPGDYTGDGRADVAFWRESTGEWFILRSEDFSFYSFPFGAPGDVPTPGDYDGDGRADPAIFRPSEGVWFKLQSQSGFEAVTFGIPGDRPVPNAFVR